MPVVWRAPAQLTLSWFLHGIFTSIAGGSAQQPRFADPNHNKADKN